jgi:SAM-dependent methyltransferase
MNAVQKLRNVVRGLKQRHGSAGTKQAIWNTEFANGRWDFIANTPDDVIYPVVERYSRGGSILDLGCGSGNTGCELASTSYRRYVGVDVSDVALDIARRRSREAGRADRNQYVHGDIARYAANGPFDVILFRESIYYVRRRDIRPMLARYARCLAEGGVFIVRLHTRAQRQELLGVVQPDFAVVEQLANDTPGSYIVVFR